MSNRVFHDGEDVWSRLRDTYIAYLESVRVHALDRNQERSLNEYLAAVREFLSEDIDRVSLLKVKLRSPDAKIALVMLEYLDVKELKGLFEEIVSLAVFAHWAVERARSAILRLHREWILARIEAVAEPLLANGTYDEYRRLLELYTLLNPELTRKLAERAVHHSDPDIREAGRDFLA